MDDAGFEQVVAGFDGFLVDEEVRPQARPALAAALRSRLAGEEPPAEVDAIVIATADEVVSRLSDGEHAVVRLRFGFDARGPLSPDQVATVLGVAAAEVTRLEAHARWKLNPRWGYE